MIYYSIRASAGSGGNISPNGDVTVARNESKSFTITPDSNYQITSVMVDGANQGAISDYTFSNVTASHTISVEFSYIGGKSDGGGGSGSGSETQSQDVPPVIYYTIAASAGSGGIISPNGDVTLVKNESKSFTITPDSNYQISSVVVDGVNQGAISDYDFSNVTANHTISAEFSYIDGSGSDGGSGESDGDGGSGSSSESPPEEIYNAQVKAATIPSYTLPVTVDIVSNTATANLGLGKTKELFESNNSVIIMPSIPGVDAFTLELSLEDLSGVQGGGNLTLATDLGSIVISADMLTGIPGTEGKLVGITINKGDKSNLPAEIKTTIGDRPIVQFTLTLDGVKTEWSNPNTPVTIKIPYTPTALELADPEHIVVWCIGSSNVIPISNGRYDSLTSEVIFTTTHFNQYAVAYVHKTFSDLDVVEWARKPIEVMASKGIISGTGVNIYSPVDNIKRADFLVLLIKTLGLTADFDSNFDDVKPGAYYYEALGIAKKLGIAVGTGNNKFNPMANISRQDMMVLTVRALEKYKGLRVIDDLAILDKYDDKKDVAGYAVSSLCTLIKEDLIKGSNDKLNPRASTTRAEAAVFLYRVYNLYFR